jgi:hypothetical protein
MKTDFKNCFDLLLKFVNFWGKIYWLIKWTKLYNKESYSFSSYILGRIAKASVGTPKITKCDLKVLNKNVFLTVYIFWRLIK